MADTEFIEFPIQTDAEALLAAAIEDIQVYFPNFNPSENSLSYRVMSALCYMMAEGRDVAAVVPPSIFRTVGSSLHNIPPNEAIPASADITLTARDDAGYETIDAGTVFSVEGVLFESTDDAEFPSGTAVAGPIGIVAIEPGEDGNELGAPGADITLEEPYDFITGVTIAAATLGGRDGETNEEFQGRLRSTLRTLSPVALKAEDLEILARTIPGVYRAVALDNFNPADGTFNNEGMAAVALQGEDGEPVALPIKDTYVALITGGNRKLVNNELFAIDADYWLVDVNWEGVAFAGAELGATEDGGNGTLATFLDPTRWGLPQSGENPGWTNKPVVSLFDLAAQLDQVEGLDRVTSIEIQIRDPDTLAVVRAFDPSDAVMGGFVPLPRPGAFNGVVTAP